MDKKFDKTIALVSGSYKPVTAGHLFMVEQYAKMADNVIVLISDPKSAKSIRKTCLGTVITAEMSKKIWEIYIKRYGLSNVQVIISNEPSPITAMFKYVDENLSDVNVIFGVSKKGGDESRFKSAMKYYADNEHINLLDPIQTAVEPFVGKSGKAVSATDIRDNIDKPNVVKKMLPAKLTDNDIKNVMKILNGNVTEDKVINSLEPLDETEAVHFAIDDSLLSKAKIAAYNVGQMLPPEKAGKAKDVPYNPKKFPEKAVDIVFPVGDVTVEVYLDTKAKKWDSDIIYRDVHVKLSPDQMEQFFSSMFYAKLQQKLQKKWPLSDELYSSLYYAIEEKEMNVNGDSNDLSEADNDKAMSNKDVDKDGQCDYTASGRKIVSFSDNQVSKKDAKFYCWPNIKKLDKWSTWKDWKKIKPLCRIRFKHGDHMYGISLSTIGEDDAYRSRGFRGYDLTQQPPVQWLSKEENVSIMQLSIVKKFLRHCIEKIEKYVKMDPEEVAAKVNDPEKLTAKEVALTQSKIRKTLNEIVKPGQIDSFSWR